MGPVKTVEASGVPPTAPTGLTVLRGSPPARSTGRTTRSRTSSGYHVYRADAAAGPLHARDRRPRPRLLHLADVGVEQWFRVTAVNSGDQEGPPSESVFATPGPAAPTGLRATAGDGEVSLAWNANVEGDLAGYDVYARIVPTGEPEQKLNDALLTATRRSATRGSSTASRSSTGGGGRHERARQRPDGDVGDASGRTASADRAHRC